MRALCLLVVGLFVLTGPSLAQKGPEIAGYYSLVGANPGGGASYSGTAEITATGGGQYQIRQLVAGDTFLGTGSFDGTTLSVFFQSTGLRGVYTLQADGSLVGIWGPEGGALTGSETLTPN